MRAYWCVSAIVLCGWLSACADDSSSTPVQQDSGIASNGMLDASSDAPALDAGDDSGQSGDVAADVADVVAVETIDGCDPLQPVYCTLPWPSSFFLADDPTTATGQRLAFGPMSLPKGTAGHIKPEAFNRRDGFATQLHAVFHFPELSYANLPSIDDNNSIDRSMTFDSPTLLIEAATGRLIPHFVEHDERSKAFNEGASTPIPVVSYLHAMHGLKPATRYIVAMRDLVDEQGAAIVPSPAFKALRDGMLTSSPSLETRRTHFEELFGTLSDLGVDRDGLILAWDFTTVSDENRHNTVLAMRDEALNTVEAEGFSITVKRCATNAKTRALLDSPDACPEEIGDGEGPIVVELEGTLELPLFLVDEEGNPSDAPGTVIARDEDGLPIRQEGSFSADFIIRIPEVALTQPGTGVMLASHGQLGDRYEVRLGYFGELAQKANLIVGSVDMHGMAGDDQAVLVQVLVDMSGWGKIIDRQRQGLVNNVLMGRFMTSKMGDHPFFVDLGVQVDGVRAFYYGASQGGIFGPSLTALWPEARTGVFGVPGISYPMLLQRSVNYATFEALMDLSYPNKMDQAMVVQLVGMVWESTEGAGFAHRLRDNPLPGSTPSEVLLLMSLSDYQVSNLSSEMMARTIGVPLMTPHNEAIWGVPLQTYPHTGSALIDFSFGNNPEPVANIPPDPGSDVQPDPHSRIAEVEPVLDILTDYWDTHTLEAACEGPCDPN